MNINDVKNICKEIYEEVLSKDKHKATGLKIVFNELLKRLNDKEEKMDIGGMFK